MRVGRLDLRKQFSHLRRGRFFEALEPRWLLTSTWQNPNDPLDVNDDGSVVAIDALIGINRLNTGASSTLPAPTLDAPPPYYDTNGDGSHSPLDTLIVINVTNGGVRFERRLVHDTAPGQGTNNDFITSDPRVMGRVSSAFGITSLTVALNGGAASDLVLDDDNEFTIEPDLSQDGTDDGPHELVFASIDDGNRAAQSTLSFTLDTTDPTIDTFGLAPGQAEADGSTTLEFVSLTGSSEPNAQIELSPGGFQTASDAEGRFQFDNYPLTIGINELTVRAIDLAGNSAERPHSITRNDDISAQLNEEGRFVTEASELVELGQPAGTRQLRFTVDAEFDTSDTTSSLGDVLLVSLVDPADKSRTLLDGKVPGGPLLEVREDGAEFRPGLVTFDGRTAEIEVSSLADETTGLLLFQLLSYDTDTTTRVTIGKIANDLDGEGISSPIFPPATPPRPAGPAIPDVESLQPSGDFVAFVENARLDGQTGRYSAELRIQNVGDGAAARQVAVVFSNLNENINMINRSGSTMSEAPYVNMTAAMPSGGLAIGEASDAVEIQFDNPNLLPMGFAPQVLVGTSNRPPVFNAVAAITTQPGAFVRQRLTASDPDGDPITFSINAGRIPTGKLEADGDLVLTPHPDDVGNFKFSVVVTDGTEIVTQDVVVDVMPPPVPSMTTVEGTILGVNEDPLSGVPVQLDDVQMETNDQGQFLFEFDAPLQNPTLMIQGDQFDGGVDYPFVAEDLQLLLGHDVFDSTINVIGNPIFLPEIDTENAVDIDPTMTTIVDTPEIDGATVTVAAGSAMEGDELFQGAISITDVPVDKTPAALPIGQSPDTVVTIQPAEVIFTTPAPLSLPNTADYPPGSLLELSSINPETGTFDIVGTGVVSTDGSVIETVSGGIRNSSWHFFTPPPEEPAAPNTNVRNQRGSCDECATVVVGSGEVALHAGTLQVSHELASYQNLGVARGLTLKYDSLRADPRPIIHFGYDSVQADPDVRLAANLVIEQGDFGVEVAGRPSQDLGLSSSENFWNIPAAGGDIEVALQAELRGQPSGRYEYSLTSGLLRENNGRFSGSRSTVRGSLLHVDSNDSPFGVGWGLAGLQELAINPDGSVLLIDGDGSERLFDPPRADGQPFISPAGDFSVLEQLPDDTFRRTLTDQTVYAFDAANRLASITDRNGNQTSFTYTGGRLTMITDPLGQGTVFTYTGDRVTGITDPAARTTVLEYDAAGNLSRIVDPDTEDRAFEYDEQNLLTAEIGKRGFRQETVYDFAGRVVSRTSADGAEIEIAPLQTQELIVPLATQQPLAAPDAFLQSAPIAFHTDGSGNTFATELDQFGQRVFSFDGEGNRDRIQRNAQNLITAVTDARGATTRYQYDALGNLTAVIRGAATNGESAADAFDLGFLDAQRTVTAHVGTLDPVDFYRFELEGTSRVEVRLEELFEDARVSLIVDVNGNGVVDNGEIAEERVDDNGESVLFTEDLEPGSYLIRVEPDTFPAGENTSYTLTVSAEQLAVTTPGDPAGNTLSAALDIGTLGTRQTFVDWVGTTDASDFYRFEVAQDNTQAWIRLSGLSEDADLLLIQDTNGDGTANANEIIMFSLRSGRAPDQLFARLGTGTYFVHVQQEAFPAGENTIYTLELEALLATATTPHDDSGNFLGNAMDIGVLNGGAGLDGSIGGVDSDDFVRFTLNEPARVRAELTGLVADARLGLVADINGDLQLDSDEEIQSSQRFSGDGPEWLEEELGPGDYFLRVYQQSFDAQLNTDYALTITAAVTASTAVTEPGENLATALSIDPFTGSRTFRENVGSLDTHDYYQFTLDAAATVSAQISQLNEDLDVAIVADIDGNGIHDTVDWIEFADRGGDPQRIVEELGPGTYYFLVYQSRFNEDQNSHYVLDLDITPFITTTAGDPGNALGTALVIDPSAGPQTFRENVGALDTNDYYKFTLEEAATVSAQISDLNEDLDVAIVADIDGNGIHDTVDWIEFAQGGGKERQRISEELGPGTYYALVYQARFNENQNSHYVLDLGITPSATTTPNDPGNVLGTALVIDPFVGPQTFRDHVGALDKNDYYKFTLDAAATVSAQISQLNEDLDVAIVADIDGNGIHDNVDWIEFAEGGGKGRQRISEELGPGTYYVLVYQDRFHDDQNSHYVLDLDVAPWATTTSSDPGNVLGTALVIDPFAGPQTFRDHVGALDKNDYYKFTLDTAATVSAQISELNENLDVALVADIDGNGVHDGIDWIEFADGGGKERQRIVEELGPGTYYFLVYQSRFNDAQNSHYVLDVDMTPIAGQQAADAGNALATATDLGSLASSLTAADTVGSLDADDFYEFTLDAAQTVQVLVRGLDEDVNVQLIEDANGNLVIDSGEALVTADRSLNGSESIVSALPAGTYFVRVHQGNFDQAENSSYELSIRIPTAAAANPADPGGNLPSATDLGVLNGAVARGDFVGDNDPDDYYRIQLNEPREVRILLSGLAEDADVRIVADIDGDLAIDTGDEIERSDSSGNAHDFISEDLGAGEYFVHVFQAGFPSNQNTAYNLEVTSTPLAITTPSDPGASLAAALDLGTLSTPQLFQEYVGSLDSDDFYRFHLAAQSEVRATLHGIVEDVTLQVVADVNNNFAIDNGDVIDSVTSSSNGLIALTETLPPGDYFVRVMPDTFPAGENTRYSLSVEPNVVPRSTLADPGETLPVALDLGTLQLGALVATQELRDAVGSLDVRDVYRFELTEIAEIRVDIEELAEDVSVSLLADDNGNLAIDDNEFIEFLTTSSADAAVLTETLPPGTYYLFVERDTFPAGENTAYKIGLGAFPVVDATMADPGETLTDAREIDPFAASGLFQDAVGDLDPLDIYRFTVGQTTELSVDLSELVEDVSLSLIADANGNSAIDNGEVIEQVVSASGDPISLTEILGPGVYFLQIAPDTFPRGENTSYNLSVAGRTRDSLFGVRTFEYEPQFGQLIREKDELGRTTLYDVDPANGNLLAQRRVVGENDSESSETDDVVTTFAYTPAGRIDTITDPLGRVTDYSYNLRGQLDGITFAQGTADEASQSFFYDTAGNLSTFIDENGVVTGYEYDSRNRLTMLTEADPDGTGPLSTSVSTFLYDAAGNLESATDALNVVTSYEYDPLNRPTKVIERGTAETDFVYDLAGNLAAVVDPLGNLTTNRYDERNRLFESRDAAGGVTGYRYDQADNLVRIIDPLGNATQFVYDERHRLIEQIDPLLNSSRFEYDAADNRIVTTDALDRQTRFVYDELDRIVEEIWLEADGGLANTIDYTYDKASNLLTVADDISSLTFTYDVRDRLDTSSNAGSPGPTVELNYIYDAAGNVITADSVSLPFGTEYSYDGRNRLTIIERTVGGDDGSRVELEYDQRNEIDAIDRFADSGGTQFVASTEITRNAFGQVMQIIHNNGSGDVAAFGYSYDALGRVLQATGQGGTVDYGYDTAGRLTSATYADAQRVDEVYIYDLAGNRISKDSVGSTFGTGNQLHSDGTFDYTYDAAGNVIRRTDRQTGDFAELTYDHRNRLTAAVQRDSLGTELQRADYTYDALNRLQSKRLEDALVTTSEHFVFDRGTLLVSFFDQDAEGVLQLPTLDRSFLGAPQVDQVFSESSGPDDVSWYLQDRLQSLRTIIDDSGTVTDRIDFDAFGSVAFDSNPQDQLYRFAGREQDPDIGLYFFPHRVYDATIGRFSSPDPLGQAAGDVNVYAYALNDPVNNTDPTGLIVPSLAVGATALRSAVSSRFVASGVSEHALALTAAASDSLLDPIALFNRTTLVSSGTAAIRGPYTRLQFGAPTSRDPLRRSALDLPAELASQIPFAGFSSELVLLSLGGQIMPRGNLASGPEDPLGFVIDVPVNGMLPGAIGRDVTRPR